MGFVKNQLISLRPDDSNTRRLRLRASSYLNPVGVLSVCVLSSRLFSPRLSLCIAPEHRSISRLSFWCLECTLMPWLSYCLSVKLSVLVGPFSGKEELGVRQLVAA